MFTVTDPPGRTASRKGGCTTHKPGCICKPCAARRRKAEALASAAGAGGTSLEQPPVSEPAGAVEGLVSITGDEAQVIDRGHRSKDRSPRARVGLWLAMRSIEPNLTNSEIAARLGISAGHLKTLIYEARKAGWLRFHDPLDQIEYGLIPKVVANLEHFLDAKDKAVTIEVAKGTVFKQYQESKGISEAPQTVLALKIETGAPDANMPVIEGRIVGKPRQIE